jgi:ATP-dependent RNA helicase SUPV3L1/SUV3
MALANPARLAAVLGPTNTGKTRYATERMLAHADGMIGLPLRLLAREVYDRVVREKGPGAAALITGEERIAPPSARYFICTVEAMPLDRSTAFLAVDEIQLCADPDRGHVFTHRLLHARGRQETLLLGSDTMRPIIRRLLPEAEVIHRERLSTLSYAGARKLTKLPKRTAIVAFSAEEVYAIAELIRRQRGGAAVVMGALSPRTRNAQVELYQSGEVDFLVATDAIGMGLNMDVDHVAFASRAKFDGRRSRPLRSDEIAQIAGRAGRFRTDGSFGETGDCAPFEEEMLVRVQEHAFEPIVALEWRNPKLDFATVTALIASLERPPEQPGLMRSRGSIDEETLKRLAQEPDIMDRVRGEPAVRRLWDACLTPDFRKVTPDEHARLVGRIASHLLGPKGRLPGDWVARELSMLDRVDGDLDALQTRLAHIRTWTYAANRADWIEDAEAFRARTRVLEDRLSDALHTALTQRFIDRRTSALMRGLRRGDALEAGVDADGDVMVEGHFVGRLEGLDFLPDPEAYGHEGRAVRNAAERALRPELARRLAAIAAAERFELGGDGRIRFGEAVVARLAPSSNPLKPCVTLKGGLFADPVSRDAAKARIEAWLLARAQGALGPLYAVSELVDGGDTPGPLRGLAYRILEQGGGLDRRSSADLIAALSGAERHALAAAGFRLGRHSVFSPLLMRKRSARLWSLLRAHAAGAPAPIVSPAAAPSAPLTEGAAWADYAAAGMRPTGPRAVRFDTLERIGAALAPQSGAVTPALSDLATLIGASEDEARKVLSALGYRPAHRADGEAGAPVRWRLSPRAATGPPASQRRPANDSPFAALATLTATPPPTPPVRRRRRGTPRR